MPILANLNECLLFHFYLNFFLFIGDTAVGVGVQRHFFSLAMIKLQHGFNIHSGMFLSPEMVSHSFQEGAMLPTHI